MFDTLIYTAMITGGVVIGYTLSQRTDAAKCDRLRTWFINYAQRCGDRQTARRLVNGQTKDPTLDITEAASRVRTYSNKRKFIGKAVRVGKIPRLCNGRFYFSLSDRFGRYYEEHILGQ